ENGKSLFVDVPSARPTFHTRASTTNTAVPPATITAGQIVDRDGVEASCPDRLVVQFDVTGGYSVRRASDNRVSLTAATLTQGETISGHGIESEIDGQPAPGGSFFVETSPKQGLISTEEELIYGLENPLPGEEGQAVFSTLVAD